MTPAQNWHLGIIFLFIVWCVTSYFGWQHVKYLERKNDELQDALLRQAGIAARTVFHDAPKPAFIQPNPTFFDRK